MMRLGNFIWQGEGGQGCIIYNIINLYCIVEMGIIDENSLIEYIYFYYDLVKLYVVYY